MSEVQVKVTRVFFDDPKIKRLMSKKERTALSQAGACVRETARQSIKYRKRMISKPGDPPFTHTKSSKSGRASIRMILFAYSPTAHGVVIGPIGMSNVRDQSVKAPTLLEFGGEVKLYVKHGKRSRHGKQRSFYRGAHYRARAFMGPAMRKELPKFAGRFRNAVVSDS